MPISEPGNRNHPPQIMSNPATRLITLIMQLQRQPNQKAGDLAGELGVSVRTVHRYIGMLEEMGIPIYSERGPHGGFSLVPGYKMPPLVFTPEEAVAVYLGTGLVEEMWGRLYGDAARGALAKLDNVLPDEQRHEVAWARRKLVATSFHRSDQESLAPTLEKLRRAVRERRLVGMLYHGRGQEQPVERRFAPYALVHRWGWWYVVGHCHLRDALRTFRVDRIRTLTLLDHTFDDPADFDIQAYLASNWQARPAIHVRMRFAPQFARIALDDAGYWETVEEQVDGAVVVSFSTPDMDWAASTVLAYGGSAVVLEPEALCVQVAKRARELVKLHEAHAEEKP